MISTFYSGFRAATWALVCSLITIQTPSAFAAGCLSHDLQILIAKEHVRGSFDVKKHEALMTTAKQTLEKAGVRVAKAACQGSNCIIQIEPLSHLSDGTPAHWLNKRALAAQKEGFTLEFETQNVADHLGAMFNPTTKKYSLSWEVLDEIRTTPLETHENAHGKASRDLDRDVKGIAPHAGETRIVDARFVAIPKGFIPEDTAALIKPYLEVIHASDEAFAHLKQSRHEYQLARKSLQEWQAAPAKYDLNDVRGQISALETSAKKALAFTEVQENIYSHIVRGEFEINRMPGADSRAQSDYLIKVKDGPQVLFSSAQYRSIFGRAFGGTADEARAFFQRALEQSLEIQKRARDSIEDAGLLSKTIAGDPRATPARKIKKAEFADTAVDLPASRVPAGFGGDAKAHFDVPAVTETRVLRAILQAGRNKELVIAANGATLPAGFRFPETFEQARNLAFKLPEGMGFSFGDYTKAEPFYSRMLQGKRAGWKMSNEKGEVAVVRLDYDPNKGAHFNIEIHNVADANGNSKSSYKVAIPFKCGGKVCSEAQLHQYLKQFDPKP